MVIDDSFEIDAPLERIWPVLLDIPRVAACIPGATITEKIDDRTYRAQVGVKAGPVSVKYRATVVVDSIDEATHTIAMHVHGEESKGRGGVRASVSSRAEARDGKTHVDLHTDAQISGIIASVGGRLIEGVAKKTVAEFAKNLQALV